MKQIDKTLYEKFIYNNEPYTRLYSYEHDIFVWWNKLGFDVSKEDLLKELEQQYQLLKQNENN